MTAATVTDSHSADGFWADNLPPAVETNDDDVTSTDDTKIVNPPPNACTECGLEIVREPGKRGRLPKTHPECKAAASLSKRGSATPRIPRASKADIEKEAQVAYVLTRLGGGLNRAIVLLSLVDPYDALVIKVNAPDILENMRALLWKYDKFRAVAAAAETGGSIFGLVQAVLFTVLPIMAHHNLIPSAKVSKMLLQAPMVMLRIQEMAARSEDGDFTAELLQRVKYQAEQTQRARAKKMDDMNGDADKASP